MKFTDELPKEEGFYFFKTLDFLEVKWVYYDFEYGALMCKESPLHNNRNSNWVDNYSSDYRFAGPIPIPSDNDNNIKNRE